MNREALETLLRKVEAGKHVNLSDFRPAFEFPMKDMEYALRPKLASNAYKGSLDAAKALHEAVLPGWTARTDTLGNAWMFSFSPETLADVPDAHSWAEGSPARAWLIAILKTLIAEADQ